MRVHPPAKDTNDQGNQVAYRHALPSALDKDLLRIQVTFWERWLPNQTDIVDMEIPIHPSVEKENWEVFIRAWIDSYKHVSYVVPENMNHEVRILEYVTRSRRLNESTTINTMPDTQRPVR